MGASADPRKPGHQVVRNMLAAGYAGPLFPVNPRETEIAGLPCYPTLASIPGGVEMVIFCAPSSATPDVLADLERRRADRDDVRVLVCVAAGFAETGSPEGDRLQESLLNYCRRNRVRLLGPNCVGVIDNGNRIDTTFIVNVTRRPGGISFVSQSGAFGAWLAMWWSSFPYPIGLNKFISLGNMSDVELNEVLEYLGEDESTRVIGMYLEGHCRARRLLETAGRIARTKPVVILKVGRTGEGALAAHTHTGSMAGADRIYDGAMRQLGLRRVETAQELSDALRAFDMLPLPAGPRTFVVTQAGGPGVYAVDALAGGPAVLADIPIKTQVALRDGLPSFAAVCRLKGHVDITASATAEQHVHAVKTALLEPAVDALILITVPVLHMPADQLASELVAALRTLGGTERLKPFLPVILAGEQVRAARQTLESAGYPTFESPEHAVQALKHLIGYASFHRWGRGQVAGPREGDLTA